MWRGLHAEKIKQGGNHPIFQTPNATGSDLRSRQNKKKIIINSRCRWEIWFDWFDYIVGFVVENFVDVDSEQPGEHERKPSEN